MLENGKEVTSYRILLGVAGAVYLLWWFAVESLLPGSFNPLPSRLVVVAILWFVLALSFLSYRVCRILRPLFAFGMWLMTAHYFFLFYENSGDINWVVGSYITVTAISLGLMSGTSLLAYSAFVVLLSAGLVFALPQLRQSVFLPGLLTILLQANIGLRSRLRALKDLAASNDRFQLLFNSTFEGVFVHEEARVVSVNEALARLLGYRRDELLGRSALDFIHPSDHAVVLERMALESIPPYEVRGVRKDGTTVDIEVRGKSFQWEGRAARLVTVQNIADRKKAGTEKVKALAMTENVRIRDEFISIASHELKTPLSSLALQAQMIERDLKSGKLGVDTSGKLAFAVQVFGRQVHRLTELVDAMLDVSRISTGRLTIERAPMDFAECVREVVVALRPETVSGEARISIEGPDHLLIHADRARVCQVIENLLTNAIKYGERRPIQVSFLARKHELELQVIDKGIGIAIEYQARIFERFERAISAQKISGLGLGLYISRKIVEAHGGSIEVESELGRGAVFRVRLPLESSTQLAR